MRRVLFTVVIFALAALAASPLEAKQKSVTGNWTLTIENFPMKFVLAQKGHAVTGRLDYPHGAPFELTGTFDKDTLTFAGGTTSRENFSIDMKATGTLKSD